MKNLFLKVILPLVGIAAILGFITVLNPIQQQEAAIVGNSGPVVCGSAGTINLAFNNDTCGGGVASVASYQPSVTFSLNNPNSKYHIDWGWYGFFCTAGNPPKCVSNNASATRNNFGSNGSLGGSVTASTSMPSKGQYAGKVCGSYQYDLDFAVYHYNGNQKVYDCAYGVQDPVNSPSSAAYCHTNTTCSTPVCNNTTTTVCEGTHSHTVTKDCHGNTVSGSDHDNGPSASCHATCEELHNCGVTPTVTPTTEPSPTLSPSPEVTVTPTGSNTNNCGNTTQTGTNDNNNCQQQQQGQSQGQTQEQNNHQTIENNANNSNTVNITLNGGGQQQQQQQVLGASTQPTQLPSTGAGADVIFGLIGLIPLGWKLRKLA